MSQSGIVRYKNESILHDSIAETAHRQFLTDRELDISNEIAREVLTLQCEQRSLKHDQAVLLANLNYWLAAKRLKLPKCSKLIPIGDLISIQQCSVVIPHSKR